jgi:hypothetical protein
MLTHRFESTPLEKKRLKGGGDDDGLGGALL